MSELDSARAQIDAADRELAVQFCRRMDAVRQVAAYKLANGLPVLDAAREEAVVQKNLALLPNAEYAAWYEAFLRDMMAVSRAYQTQLLGRDAVAYQGVEGAFSHIALNALFPHARALAYPTWGEVFDAVARGEAEHGVLPFENSQAGDVSAVLDLCFAQDTLYITQMYDLPVRQNLLGLPGAELTQVRRVVSHPQALAQSERFLQQLGLETQSFANTAAAAKHVAEAGDKTVAAIASEETAALYGLTVLARNINAAEDNTTRFIVLGRELPRQGNRFSLLFTVSHKAGSLAKVLQTVSELGYNMECIKSRPMPHMKWEYYFYAELIGSLTDEFLGAIRSVCRTVRVLGIFDRV